MILGAMMQAAGSLWSIGSGLTEMGRANAIRLRQLRMAQAQKTGEARSIAGASGVEFSSETIQRHLQTMQMEFTRQASNLEYGGDQAAINMALSTGMQGLSDVGKGVAQQGAMDNWWRSSSKDGYI